MLQDKLNFISAKKESLQNAPTDTEQTPSEECYGRRKFGGKFGHSCPRISPEIIANFRQCKLDLQNARATGNPEQIQAAMTALQQAKQRKFEAREQLREAKKQEEEKVNAETTPGSSSL
jgi:hypothetical protein